VYGDGGGEKGGNNVGGWRGVNVGGNNVRENNVVGSALKC
jgi:hypothetical protein